MRRYHRAPTEAGVQEKAGFELASVTPRLHRCQVGCATRCRCPRSRNAKASRKTPKTSAYAPIHSTIASAPAPGANRINDAEQQRRHTHQDQKPLVRDRFPETNARDDFKHSGEDRQNAIK